MRAREIVVAGLAALVCMGVGRAQTTTSGSPAARGGTSAPAGPGAPVGSATPTDLDLPVSKPVYQGAPIEAEPPPQPPEIDPPTETPPTFFGEEIDSSNDTIVYVIDVSGSMSWDPQRFPMPGQSTTSIGPRIDRAKAELVRSIEGLSENFRFNLIAYNCATVQWKSAMQRATSANKSDAIGWVEGQQATGGTGTGPACAAALGEKEAMTVVLLTDGAPNCGANQIPGHRRMINNANTQRAAVNVFGINASGYYRAFCQSVASDNSGTYVDIP